MKFAIAKSYPHPVLRIGSSDYIDTEFEMEFSVERIQSTTAIEINAKFILTDPYLRQQIKTENAEYLLLVRCNTTFFRQEFRATEPNLNNVFTSGLLAGRTEFSPFIVSKNRIIGFRSDNWNSDYDNLSFNIEPGSVFATAPPEIFWIDTADETQVGSIFESLPSDAIPTGYWDCFLESDRIQLRMAKTDFQLFLKARKEKLNTPDAEYIMNSIYLPALIWVLMDTDANFEDSNYDTWRWFSSLNQKLEESQIPPLGKNSNRLADAQKLLSAPFSRLPFLDI